MGYGLIFDGGKKLEFYGGILHGVIYMFVKKTSFWLTSFAGFFFLFAVLTFNVHAADEDDVEPAAQAGQNENADAGWEVQEAGSSNFTDSKVAELPYVLPNLYKRHLVSVFSLMHVIDNHGVANENLSNSRDTYTSMSASFAYNLQRKHSEYVIDYSGSGRYSSNSGAETAFTHDLGLSQVVQLTSRLTWILNHRFSHTPDFSGSLLREELVKQRSFTSPVPLGGIQSLSALVNPFPILQLPTDGLDNTLQSFFVLQLLEYK